MKWKLILMILCLFGFLKEFRPTDPFLYKQLTGHWRNFTDIQVSQEIYPLSIYSYFATLILIFLLTDLLRYKPIILLCGVSGIATYFLLIIGTTVAMNQALQFTYGLFMSTEVAYYTYIYAKVDKKDYEKVTSCTRAAVLTGKFTSAAVGQIIVIFDLLDYFQLNYISISSMIFTTICALFLPSVDHSIYFHKGTKESEKSETSANNTKLEIKSELETSLLTKLKRAYGLLWRDFLHAYSNFEVVKWSLWWALATCGYLQIITYVQVLWEAAADTENVIYNGTVEAICTFVGAVAVSLVGMLKINWILYGDFILASFSILEGLLLWTASQTLNVFVMYGCYMTFGVIYQTIVTVASFEVAKRIPEDSYGLIFGINVFVALTVQCLFMYVVVDGRFFQTTIRDQFLMYGVFFIFIGVIFAIFVAQKLCCVRRSTEDKNCIKIIS